MDDNTITDIPVIDPIADEKLRVERQHFVDEAFLKALPIALTVRDWTKKTEQGSTVVIATQKDRIALAWEIAQECYTNRLTVK